MKLSLREYQEDGVAWMLWHLMDEKGFILADEMGLGKTIQIIELFKRLPKRFFPALFIAPLSCIHSHEKEFIKWGAPPTSLYYGAKRTLDPKSDIVITNYNTFKNDHLERIGWNFVLLDEGHVIRNPQTQIAQALMKIKTPHRAILTGTPYQNHPGELWGLFNWLMPSYLGTESWFKANFISPLNDGIQNRHLVTQAQQTAKALKELISPYILQRTGHRSSQKKEFVLRVPQSEDQMDACRKINRRFKRALFLSLEGKEEYEKEEIKKNLSLRREHDLRDVCNGTYQEGMKTGKMEAMKEMIPRFIQQGHQVAIFLRSLRALHSLSTLLSTLTIKHLIISGETPAEKRQDSIHLFNTDPSYSVFIMTRCGVFGINLPVATRIILFEPDWNPERDNQAAHRSFRFGQTQNVGVYRILTEGSIEERVYEVQLEKQCGKALLSCNIPQKESNEGVVLKELNPLESEKYSVLSHDKTLSKKTKDYQVYESTKDIRERFQRVIKEQKKEKKRREKRREKAKQKVRQKIIYYCKQNYSVPCMKKKLIKYGKKKGLHPNTVQRIIYYMAKNNDTPG